LEQYNSASATSKSDCEITRARAGRKRGFLAGEYIGSTGWAADELRRVRLSLPAEYRYVAGRRRIYSFPSRIGADPMAVVICYQRPHGTIERHFEPIPSELRSKAIQDLAFGASQHSDAWMKYAYAFRSEFEGVFSITNFVAVR
jgi:hypothetical protein